MIKTLRYGNTNTFFIQGEQGGLLVDTDYAGTLQGFFRAIKSAGIGLSDISYMIMTHYHPDHMGIAGELQGLGIRLAIADVQLSSVHFSDRIFDREGRFGYRPIDEASARIITIPQSRSFLAELGIEGEMLHTPSHSEDSISIVLDSGDCFVGDLEPLEYLAAYGDNDSLQADWDLLLSRHPKTIHYAHVNEKSLQQDHL